ncbi:hypothetical protein ASZ78_004138 [Callipepla squamata]|uniref:DUF1977 domain-containing protein n=1 Tax=Callipepla squamata TaxID=9009 RepID=A0A226N8B4_CALSU|nr:hypothetical protein ASZ78_004138 [Callipepla squamata]
MESNRDEAERCIGIALAAVKARQPERARRFLEKAQRLYPSPRVRALLESLNKSEPSSDGQPQARDTPHAQFGKGGRDVPSANGGAGGEAPKGYTQDQLDAVKSCLWMKALAIVQRNNDLNETCSSSATAIGNAYAVLSNPEKRKQYDQFGDEKLSPARHGHAHSDFHRGFEADISPEDLFNMFFGGGFPSSNVHVYSNGRMRYTYHQRQDRREHQGDGGLGLFVQLMPILILIIVSALSQMMVSSPPYSLSQRPLVLCTLEHGIGWALGGWVARSVGHMHRRVTEHLKVIYYVSENFVEEYTGTNLKNVERSVEDDYIANLRNNCWKEKQQSE